MAAPRIAHAGPAHVAGPRIARGAPHIAAPRIAHAAPHIAADDASPVVAVTPSPEETAPC